MQLSLPEILILAVVQGVTEFLPVSSDGHLVVVSHWMQEHGTKPPDIGDLIIVLHVGTLFSILVFYYERVWRLLTSERRVLWMIVLATIPAVIVGLPVKKFCEQILENVWLAGAMFPVTGAALLYLSYKPTGNVEYPQMTIRQAIWIGISQAAAILPGLSRSGSTIATGVGVGLTRGSAAAFSFLMAIPVIAGAGTLEALDFWQEGKLSTPISHMLLGAVVSFVVGLGTLWCLNRWLEKGRLQIFAWYCIVLGIAVLAWQGWELSRA
ncbi:MAG: undecaprenyl-diphosphate phosphatase [Pirellulaceae bacterium]